MTTQITVNFEFLSYLLMYLGPGMPPPYNPLYDLNGSGMITVADLLIALSLFVQ